MNQIKPPGGQFHSTVVLLLSSSTTVVKYRTEQPSTEPEPKNGETFQVISIAHTYVN